MRSSVVVETRRRFHSSDDAPVGDNIRLCLVRTSRDVKPASWAQTLERDAGGDVDRKTICLDERPRLVENSEAVIQKNVQICLFLSARFCINPL